jgi:hypothetical protein
VAVSPVGRVSQVMLPSLAVLQLSKTIPACAGEINMATPMMDKTNLLFNTLMYTDWTAVILLLLTAAPLAVVVATAAFFIWWQKRAKF